LNRIVPHAPPLTPSQDQVLLRERLEENMESAERRASFLDYYLRNPNQQQYTGNELHILKETHDDTERYFLHLNYTFIHSFIVKK